MTTMRTFFVQLLSFFLFASLSAKQTLPDASHLTRSIAPVHLADESTLSSLPKQMTLDTIYGKIVVTDKVIIELLHHQVMTRLHKVDQHGPWTYFGKNKSFSRYDHSVGVYFLLKKFGASLTEQACGLLHDASHTVFSHLADRFFKTGNQNAYQDHIHEWYLQQLGVDKILSKYDMSLGDMNPENYPMLKNKLPALCVDRIEYNIRTGLTFDRLTQEQVTQIVTDLRFENGGWFFTNTQSARLIADQSTHFTMHFWGSAENTAQIHWTVSALRQLVARNLVSFSDIHFGTDKQVLDVIENTSDKHVKEMVEKSSNPRKYFKVVSSVTDHDLTDYPKCRAINPLVLQEDGKKVLLTELDAEFKKAYHEVKHHCQRGLKLKFL